MQSISILFDVIYLLHTVERTLVVIYFRKIHCFHWFIYHEENGFLVYMFRYDLNFCEIVLNTVATNITIEYFTHWQWILPHHPYSNKIVEINTKNCCKLCNLQKKSERHFRPSYWETKESTSHHFYSTFMLRILCNIC